MKDNMHVLNTLLQRLNYEGEAKYPVLYSGIVMNSQQVSYGDVFLAVMGESTDGRTFIQQAIERGAVAVLAERDQNLCTSYEQEGVVVYAINNLHAYVGDIFNHWFCSPSSHLQVIGVTGTNGKTSCSFFLAQALKYLGELAGVIGTVGKGIYPDLVPFGNTTPGTYEVHETLSHWVNQKTAWAVMEVTSHALVQRRVDGVSFDTALFTNISRDHLDYHPSMYAYVKAKSALFSKPGLKYAVINIDDEYSQVMYNAVDKSTRMISYSLADGQADIYLTDCKVSNKGTEARIVTPWGKGIFTTSLFGRFNLYNLLGVIGVLGAHDFLLSDVLAAVAVMGNVPGRMAVYGGQENLPRVVVDYSHTPDALANALSAIREQHAQGITCIFGCGGDRDRGKRPLMMKAALDYADHIVLTSDNPRFEDPKQIINDALEWVSNADSTRITVEPDRKQAIKQAILKSNATDVVFIAGKGHEDYQEIKGVKYHLDDSEEALSALSLKK